MTAITLQFCEHNLEEVLKHISQDNNLRFFPHKHEIKRIRDKKLLTYSIPGQKFEFPKRIRSYHSYDEPLAGYGSKLALSHKRLSSEHLRSYLIHELGVPAKGKHSGNIRYDFTAENIPLFMDRDELPYSLTFVLEEPQIDNDCELNDFSYRALRIPPIAKRFAQDAIWIDGFIEENNIQPEVSLDVPKRVVYERHL